MPEKKFVGRREVASVVHEEFKTPGGADVVRITFVDGFKELMPMKSYEALVSTQVSDDTELRKAKLKLITKDVLKVVAEHDLKLGEVDELNRQVGAAIFESANRATHFLWTDKDESYVPGFNSVLELSLLDVEEVLKTIPAKTNEATSEENK